MADLTSEASHVGGGAKLSKAELLKRNRERVNMSRKWREQEGFDKTWKRLKDLYAGKQFQTLSEDDRIAVNISFATINVIAPSIAVNHPKITVSARSQDSEDKAIITEAVVNYWWQHYKFKPEFRRSVKDYLIYGHGWLKVGYRYEETLVPLSDDEFADKFHLAKAQADDYAEANPHLADQLPTDDEISSGIETTKPFVIHDQPFVERVSPNDIFVDPEATCEADMLWIAQRITRTLEEVKLDKRYPYSVRKNLDADGEVTSDWLSQDRKKYGDDIKRVTLWEFYDLQRKTLCVFPESGDRFLVDPIPMPYSYGIPFVMIRNYDIPDEFYPMGDLEAIAPLQDELNETRSAMVAARNQDLPKTLYRTSLGSKTINALRSDVRGELVPIDGEEPFDQLIAPVPHAAGSPQLYQHSDVIESDVDRISGVNEYMRGGVPETRRTATEASIIQDAANSRAADKLDQIEATIGEVGRRVVALAQQYMTGQQVARVTGTNATVWVPFSRRDIEGEFDFSVEGGSTQPMNESFRRQQASQLLQSMSPFLESGIINVPELLQYTLQFGFGITNPGRFISQAPPPKQGPDTKLVETMAYKDTPPDIQRQIEEAAGFQPSAIGGVSQAEQSGAPLAGDGPPDDGGQAPAAGDQTHQLEGQTGYDPATLGANATQRLNKT